MKPLVAAAAIACAAAILFTGAPLRAVSGGQIGVLPKGRYVCELPGDAGDPGMASGRHQPEADFTVIGNSSYNAAGARGSYFLAGDTLAFTSGPFDGRRMHRLRGNFLRAIAADGSDGALRCVNSLQAMAPAPQDDRPCKHRKAAARTARAGRSDAPVC